MKPFTFKALVAEEVNGEFIQTVKSVPTSILPDHDVVIQVQYSSLNYKDMLSATGDHRVTKCYPFIPGIDAAGTVFYSKDKRYKKGDEVIVTSFDLGMNTPGGFGRYISVPGDWIIPLPDSMSLKESMMIGTSGLTAAMGVKKIVDHNISPADGRVVVSGATGAVGTFSIALLSHLGFQCDVITGKQTRHKFLKSLGASTVIDRDQFYATEKKPLMKSRWIAGLDSVGGNMLDLILRQIAHNGILTCCGNVSGETIETSIYPFILRGVSLMGIDSGIATFQDRLDIWNLFATDWKLTNLADFSTTVDLSTLSSEILNVLKSDRIGNTLVQLSDS